MAKKKQPKKRKIVDKIVFETFMPFRAYERSNMEVKEPTSFNGMVRVRKYRITIEEIEETPEVIGQRVQDLWDTCNNHHHWSPLRAAAKEVGWELQGQAGSKCKDRK